MRQTLTAQRAQGAMRVFADAGVLAPADVHVATRLGLLGGETDEQVLLAVALTVRALRLGSVCVDLNRLPDLAGEPSAHRDTNDLPWPQPESLKDALRRSPLVAGSPKGPLTPVTLVDTVTGPLLALTRYHRHEETVRTVLAQRGRTRPTVDVDTVQASLDELFPRSHSPDRQRIAAALAVSEWTTIIAGGPGTGKTHTAARIVALLYAVHSQSLRVALSAPTGKAAARLQESITAQAEELGLPNDMAPATTLHRLLGPRRDSRTRFTHHANNRLPHDVIVVDETSMVPLTLMARLTEALRPQTRLILLGDPDQLASVDAGAVLADLVARATARPTNPDLARLGHADLTAPAAGTREPPLSKQEREQLSAGVIRLRHGHRFTGVIADLADAVRRGAADDTMSIFRSGSPAVTWHAPDDLDTLRADVTQAGLALLEAAEQEDVPTALAALGTHQLLCAHREGPFGVRHWSQMALEWTSAACQRPLDPDHRYPGQPLLVIETDQDAGLRNGDAGVVIRRGNGVVAAFNKGATPKLVHPSQLSAVQTAYAMTIHRSQGSQYDTVSIVLPDETSPILTRQLLYTAITRARSRVRVIGQEEAVRAAVGRPALRASGLSRSGASKNLYSGAGG